LIRPGVGGIGRELLAWSEQAGRELLAGETGVLGWTFNPPDDAVALCAALGLQQAMVGAHAAGLALPFRRYRHSTGLRT
jgi:hypothetical protein